MRYIAPALLSLAALAAAQSTDCVTRYETCLGNKDEPSCNAELTTCKDSCGKDLSACNQSGVESSQCQTQYNSCLNTFPIIPGGSDCVAKFIKCSNSGQSASSCNAQNAVCKDSCSSINSERRPGRRLIEGNTATGLTHACLSSGSADKAACDKQYNQCYVSTDDTIEIDTITKYQAALSSGKSVAESNVVLKDAKDACSTVFDTCLSSGTSDRTFCADLTNKCYYNNSKWTLPSCSSSFDACKASGKADADCRAALTSCKDTCTSARAAACAGEGSDATACASLQQTCQGSSSDPSGNTDTATTFSAKVAAPTGGYTYANGTSGNNATATHTPTIYTGAADKAGVASMAGLLALAAYIL